MPEKLQKTTAPATTTSSPTTAPASSQGDAQDQFGNSHVQGQQKSPGQLSWEGALGEFLGSKLYDAISDQLTDEELVGHAQSAVSSATGAMNDYLQGNVEATDQEAAKMFVQALDGELRSAAARLVTDTGLADGLRDFVDDNPVAIATAALAGAVAYIVSNQDLPLIDTSHSLGGGHSVIGGVDPGRTMELAIEQVRVGYRYQGNTTRLELIGDWFAGGYQLSTKVQQDLGAYGAMTAGAAYSDIDGNTRERLDLGYSNDNLDASAYYERSRGTDGSDLSTLGGKISNIAAQDRIQAYMRGETRSDGSWEAASGLSRQLEDWGWSIEGFGGQTSSGQSDSGVRAMFQMRF